MEVRQELLDIEATASEIVRLETEITGITEQIGLPKEFHLEERGLTEREYWIWRRKAQYARKCMRQERDSLKLELRTLRAAAHEQTRKDKALFRLIAKHEDALKMANAIDISPDDHVAIIARASKLLGRSLAGEIDANETRALLVVMEAIVCDEAHDRAVSELEAA